MVKEVDSEKRFSLALLALMAIAMVAWQLCCTDWVDDWNYKMMPTGHEEFWHIEGDEEITTLSQAIEAVGRHHLYVTPRMPNYIQVFCNLVPAWVTRVFLGLTLASAFVMILVSVGGRRIFSSAVMVAFSWLLAWVALPLGDHMVSSDFALNYFLPTPLILLFVYFFLKDSLSCGPWRWLSFVVAAVAGSMHEGVTLPVSAGCLLLILIEPVDRKRRVAMWATMTVVALVFFLAPSTFARVDQYVLDHDSRFVKWQVINLLIECFGLYFALVALVIARVKGNLKIFVRANVIWLVAFAGCLIIAFATLKRGRVLWYADVFGIILLLKSLWAFFPWWRGCHYFVASVCGAVLLVSIAATAVVQRQLSADSDAILKQVKETGKPIAFHDYRDPATNPWWAFGVPQTITEDYSNSSLAMYCSDAPYIMMLPASFRGKPVECWEKFPGNTGLSGNFPFLAGRKRVQGGFFNVTMGELTPFGNPLYSLANKLRGVSTTPYQVNEWSIMYEGDTLWCYKVSYLRRLDVNRVILSIDTIP